MACYEAEANLRILMEHFSKKANELKPPNLHLCTHICPGSFPVHAKIIWWTLGQDDTRKILKRTEFFINDFDSFKEVATSLIQELYWLANPDLLEDNEASTTIYFLPFENNNSARGEKSLFSHSI